MNSLQAWLRSLRRESRPPKNESTAIAPSSTPTDAQIKHLEFIQSVITRMATNSFLAKGWGLTVAGAFYGFAVNHLNPWIALLGLMPVITFWWLDGYFLRTERLYRCLYDDARRPATVIELFSMNVSSYRTDSYCSWRRSVFSLTLNVFYGLLLAAGLAVLAVSIAHSVRPAHPARTTSARSSSSSSFHSLFGGQISPIPSPRQRGTR